MTHLSNSNSGKASSAEPTRNPLIITDRVLTEVLAERIQQDDQWGEQNHPDGTGIEGDAHRADQSKEINDYLVKLGTLTFRDILYEEVMEAFAERDVQRLREELIQVAAVAVAWVEAIDRRVP